MMRLHTLTPGMECIMPLSDCEPDYEHVAKVYVEAGEVMLTDDPEFGPFVTLSYTPEDADRIGRALIAAARAARGA